MTVTLRVLLIIASLISLILTIKKINQSKLKISESIIWVFGSLVLIFMSIFSGFVVIISNKLGFMAPANFVFLIVIVFLIVQVFVDNIKISNLNEKIKELDHYIALQNLEHKEK